MKDWISQSIVLPLKQLWSRPVFRIVVLVALVPSVLALVTHCATSGGPTSQRSSYFQQSAPAQPTQPGQMPSILRYAKGLFAPKARTTARSIGGQRPIPPAPSMPAAGGSLGYPLYGDEIPHIEAKTGGEQ